MADALRGEHGTPPGVHDVSDDDLHLALWTAYELHYRGFDDAVDDAEWDPVVLGVRRQLESRFESDLRDRVGATDLPADVGQYLLDLAEADDGPSVATFVRRHATRGQVESLLKERSVYHLKESDPVSWVVPRLDTRPKAALMELQFDEYGDGDPTRLHHQLFADGLVSSGLSNTYGDYVGDASTATLAQNNAVSMFGLHRRLRGAALGHLAVFEATSSLPSRKMAQGLERLGFSAEMVGYYLEHVEADAVHEQLAARSICGALAADEPDQVGQIVFGARVCLMLETDFATRTLLAWEAA